MLTGEGRCTRRTRVLASELGCWQENRGAAEKQGADRRTGLPQRSRVHQENWGADRRSGVHQENRGAEGRTGVHQRAVVLTREAGC